MDPATTSQPSTTTAASTTGDPTTGATTDSDGTATSATCSGPDGQIDSECGDPTPFCLAGECVGCGALSADACETLDAANPICDQATGGCVPCTEHDQCSTGACILTTGAASCLRIHPSRSENMPTGTSVYPTT